MALDFYNATQETSRNLTQTERLLFDYVIKNMGAVKDMSIRQFAAKHFVSTTTIHRFTRKLGFSGFSDFINSILITTYTQQDVALPAALHDHNYLKNAMETVRVMSPEQIKKVISRLKQKPNIYILTDANTHTIGQYCERLFIGLGFHAYFPEAAYQTQNLVNRIRSGDMLIALSYCGQDVELIDFIQRVYLTARPYLLSVTRADNNPLENLSDTNFYVFTDEVRVPGMDLTSGVTMLMVIELLIYEYIATTLPKM